MYSELLLDHFRNPRNAGKLANASAEVTATNPICGDILELGVRPTITVPSTVGMTSTP